MKTEWGIGDGAGFQSVFPCRDESHARGLMASTSVVLPKVKVLVTRTVTDWTPVPGESATAHQQTPVTYDERSRTRSLHCLYGAHGSCEGTISAGGRERCGCPHHDHEKED